MTVGTMIPVIREFIRKDKIHQTVSFCISDLQTTNAEILLDGIRDHWYIENKLHYTRDVIQKEDKTATKNWCCIKKYAIINIWHSGNKVLLLDYDNKNSPSLPRLPKREDKEKR
jgi:hypothetical protein